MSTRFGLLAALLALLVLILGSEAPAPAVQAFGTINSTILGYRAEHERITRAALACQPGVQSTGDCFEARSIDQLAGPTGTFFGAVGQPDVDEIFDPTAHCDDADFLDVPGYPRSRDQATTQLLACVNHLRGDFKQGVTAASGLLANGTSELIKTAVDLSSDCTFTLNAPGLAKCKAIEGLGRALHGAQDFYSHSNWADEADPQPPILLGGPIDNPPGLNLAGPSPILDLAGTSNPSVPNDLTTGYFKVNVILGIPIPSDNCPATDGRVTHACLNKDKELIDPKTGAVSDPLTIRGSVLDNAPKAVAGAIVETRRQWSDFRQALIGRYGAERGRCMALAMTQDVPKQPCPPPVGGISIDPSASALPLQSQPSSGSDAWLLEAIAAATAVVALGSAAWYARRRRV